MAATAESNLQDPNFWVRYQAAQALTESRTSLDESVICALVRLLTGDESKLVRHEAAKALSSAGPAVAPHSAALASALGDAEPLVRRDAAKALCVVGAAGAQRHLQEIASAMSDEFWPVRWWASKTLGVLGEVASAHAGLLAKACMADGETAVQEAAAVSLGAMGASATQYVHKLGQTLLVGGDQERRWAGDALATVLGDASTKKRRDTAAGLAFLAKQAEDNIPRVIKNVADREERHMGEKHRIQALQSALSDEDWLTRRHAISALAAFALAGADTAT